MNVYFVLATRCVIRISESSDNEQQIGISEPSEDRHKAIQGQTLDVLPLMVTES